MILPTLLILLDCVLIQHFLSHLPLIQMPLSFLWSAQISDVFVLLRPLLSFFHFQGFPHAVEDAVRLLVVAILDVTPILVVVVVSVTLILVALIFSWPLVFQSTAFQCLLGFLLAIVEISFWSPNWIKDSLLFVLLLMSRSADQMLRLLKHLSGTDISQPGSQVLRRPGSSLGSID